MADKPKKKPKVVSKKARATNPGQAYFDETAAEIERCRYASKSWQAILPIVEKAITQKMHALGVPANPEDTTAFNHYHHTALTVAYSIHNIYVDEYLNRAAATGKHAIKAEIDYKSAVTHVMEQYKGLAELVAQYGNLEKAYTADGRRAGALISQFTQKASLVRQQKHKVSISIEDEKGPSKQELTKLQLEEEFLKTIELAGVDIVMLYLKKEFDLKPELGITPPKGVTIPAKPALPQTIPPPKAR